MAVFKVEAKTKVDIDKKPRVYFTCHPEDFEKYFKKVCNDIFKTHDCAIYYTEDMTEGIAEDEKQVDLGRNNLFVVPVTFKLLSTPNRAMDKDIPYALKEHIPVLPIMMEPGIDEFYSKPDKFGELQYLNPYSTDLTEISYEEKLKKYLESVLISDELAKRVRAAFDAYIFLSYRKKDRKYANELMRLIHSNPECRDIAIWFDEFLTPGESFKENIEKILDDCKLFTLLVTPQLLEKVVDENGEERDNYVISTELPLARKKKEEKGTDIFAVEMENTDREALSAISIEDYTNPENADFRARLLETISRMAITTNNTPEHNFLIGLAYLEGIDVEVDRERAVKLITSAAKTDLPEAMECLRKMYHEGNGVLPDYKESTNWSKRIVDLYEKIYGPEHHKTLIANANLVVGFIEIGNIEYAIKLCEKLYPLFSKEFGIDSYYTLTLINNLGYCYDSLGNHNDAVSAYEIVYSVSKKIYGATEPIALVALNNLASAYLKKGDTLQAIEMFEYIYSIRCELLGEEHQHTLDTLNNIALSEAKLKRFSRAIQHGNTVYLLSDKTMGALHPETIVSLENLGLYYRENSDYEASLICFEKAYLAKKAIEGENSQNTLRNLLYLANAFYYVGDAEKAIELFEMLYIQYKDETIEKSESLLALNNYACALLKAGKTKQALDKFLLAYDTHCDFFGENSPEAVDILYGIAFCNGELGYTDKAVELYECVLEKRREIFGNEHSKTIAIMKKLSDIYVAFEKNEQLLRISEMLCNTCLKTSRRNAEDILDDLQSIVIYFEENSEYQKAVIINNKIYQINCLLYGEKSQKTLTALNALAYSNKNVQNKEKAIECFEKVFHLCKDLVGLEHSATVNALYALATCYEEFGYYHAALLEYKELYDLYLKILGSSHNNTIAIKRKIELIEKLINN